MQDKNKRRYLWLRWAMAGLASVSLAQGLTAPKLNRGAQVAGGFSSGDRFDVFGTIGQPGGGVFTGGSFRLVGGFVAAPAPPFNATQGWPQYR